MRALCSEALAGKRELIDVAVDVERQQRLEHLGDAGFEKDLPPRVDGDGVAALRPDLVKKFAQAVQGEHGRTTGSCTSVFL
jgi:hypothetical protein